MRVFAALLIAILTLGVPSAARAASPLTPAEQLSIARQFAPVLVFHPEEEYFPVSSLFESDSAVNPPDESILQAVIDGLRAL